MGKKTIKILLEQKIPKHFSIKVYSNVIEILDIASINSYITPPPVTLTKGKVFSWEKVVY